MTGAAAHEVSSLCSCTLGQAQDLLDDHNDSVQASVNAYYQAVEGGKSAKEFEQMSVKELRRHIQSLGHSTEGALEKCDLVTRAISCHGGKTYAFVETVEPEPAEREVLPKVLSFEEAVYEALSKKPTPKGERLADVLDELVALEKEQLAERVTKDCLSTVNPTVLVEGIFDLSELLAQLPDTRQDTRRALQRLFSMMINAVGVDPEQVAREKTATRYEELLNQVSDVLDIKVRPDGPQEETSVEQLVEDCATACDMAAQALEVWKSFIRGC